MLPELNRNKRKTIFRVETYPLAAIFLVCLYFFIIAGNIDLYDKPDKINCPESFGDGAVCHLETPYVCVIYLTKDNRLYLNIDNVEIRRNLLCKVGSFYNKDFSGEELNIFENGLYFGDDIRSFILSTNKFHRKHQGIPHTKDNNQLLIWVKSIREIAPKYRFQLIADKEQSFKEIDFIFKTLQANGINRINLLTNLVEQKS